MSEAKKVQVGVKISRATVKRIESKGRKSGYAMGTGRVNISKWCADIIEQAAK